jgi:hypothetical protein
MFARPASFASLDRIVGPPRHLRGAYAVSDIYAYTVTPWRPTVEHAYRPVHKALSLLCCPTVFVGPVPCLGARASISDSSAAGQMSRGAGHGHASTAHGPWTRNTTRPQHSPPPSIVGRLRAVIWGRRLADTGMRRLSPASAESAAAAVRLARSHECGYGRQRNSECAVLSLLLLHIARLGIQVWLR